MDWQSRLVEPVYALVITYADALQLTKEAAPDVRRVLLENAPKEKGGPSSNGKTPVATPKFSRNNSKSATVLSVRLAREYPKHYEAYMRGEFKIVTAAAIVWDDGLWPVEFTAKAPASLFALAGRTEQKTISSFYGATAIMLSD